MLWVRIHHYFQRGWEERFTATYAKDLDKLVDVKKLVGSFLPLWDKTCFGKASSFHVSGIFYRRLVVDVGSELLPLLPSLEAISSVSCPSGKRKKFFFF